MDTTKGMFMWFIVHPGADVGNVQSCTRLPSSGFQLASYSWSVISFMIGPVEASGSGPLRIILSTEVVTVST